MKCIECRLVDVKKMYSIKSWAGVKEIPVEDWEGICHEQTGVWNIIDEFYIVDGERKISKAEFEKYYTVVKGNYVTDEMVEKSIADIQVQTVDNITTLVKCEMNNGFIIYDSSSSSSKENYSVKIGSEICIHRIKDKICGLLGFLLKTAGGKNVQQ